MLNTGSTCVCTPRSNRRSLNSSLNQGSSNRPRLPTSSSLVTNSTNSSSTNSTRRGGRARPRRSTSFCHPCCCSDRRRPTRPPSRSPRCSHRLLSPRNPTLKCRLLLRWHLSSPLVGLCRRRRNGLVVFGCSHRLVSGVFAFGMTVWKLETLQNSRSCEYIEQDEYWSEEINRNARQKSRARLEPQSQSNRGSENKEKNS
jgi:hypothetical protein